MKRNTRVLIYGIFRRVFSVSKIVLAGIPSLFWRKATMRGRPEERRSNFATLSVSSTQFGRAGAERGR